MSEEVAQIFSLTCRLGDHLDGCIFYYWSSMGLVGVVHLRFLIPCRNEQAMQYRRQRNWVGYWKWQRKYGLQMRGRRLLRRVLVR